MADKEWKCWMLNNRKPSGKKKNGWVQMLSIGTDVNQFKSMLTNANQC